MEKNNLILSLEFGKILGGANSGLPAFTLYFTGLPGGPGDMANALFELQQHEGAFCKTVLLTGEFTEENDDDVQVLIASLKNYGWSILVDTDPLTYRPWFTRPVRVGGVLLPGVDWLTVKMEKDSRWAPFWCNEFIYFIESEKAEPILPNDPNNAIRYYIDGEEKIVWDFLKRSEKKWRFLK